MSRGVAREGPSGIRDRRDGMSGPGKEKARTRRCGLKPPYEEVEETVRILPAFLVRRNIIFRATVSEITQGARTPCIDQDIVAPQGLLHRDTGR
jgi:hypothetical protein